MWENLGTSHVDLPRETPSFASFGHLRHTLKVASIGFKLRRGHLIVSSSITLVLLLTLISVLAISAFSTLKLPPLVQSPRSLTLLAALILFFAVRTYTDALLTLGSYGRFIRPGLRSLLEEHGQSLLQGEKLFRGRKAVVLKIDVADFTATTFEMPYGMRRLFVDLWFTLIDHVVAENVFLDKSLGDGSVYYFDDGLAGGSCAIALKAAFRIRDHQVRQFDETFGRLFREHLEECAELAAPTQIFLDNFRKRVGKDFWERQTQVRIALVSGYVDEGLWGLSAQSHYDAQGKLPILASRLEEQAKIGEIVFDENFIDELEREQPGAVDRSVVERRKVDLKGIGVLEMLILPSSDG